MEEFSVNNEPGHATSRFNKKNIFYVFGVVVFLVIFYSLFLSSPGDFFPGTVIRVERGASLRDVSFILQKEHVIRSRAIFESFVIILGGEKHVVSADYLFESKLPVWQVAMRMRGGEHRMAPVSLTIPEGFNVSQVADAAALHLINFDKDQFILKAKDKEGYLFPDTYFFFTDANGEDVLRLMSNNFNKKVAPLLPEITSSGKTKEDIVIMASIIEEEAEGDIDREIISGILWKRISIGMPLQVDSAPETYKTKGLPETPIGNPGLLAIKAAIHPQSSSYLYYLHDKNGDIHYAKNFTEHKKNISKYLK